MATNVIEVVFQQRNAERVAEASRLVGRSLRDLDPASDAVQQGLADVERQSDQTQRSLQSLSEVDAPKVDAKISKEAERDAAKLQKELDKLSREFDRTREKGRRLNGLSNVFNRLGSGGASVLKLAGALGLAGAAAAGLVGIISTLRQKAGEAIQAAAAQEQAELRVAVALQQVGAFSSAAVRDLKEYAAAQQRVTEFGDEQVLMTSALIQQLGRLRGQELKQTTSLALDMAAALGRNVDQIAILLGKAAAGETGSLSEYGIIIDRTLPQSEKFAAALEAIDRAFGGTAQARVKSYAGATAQLRNAMGDLGESLGNLVLPRLTRFANEATSFVNKVTDAVRRFRGETDLSVRELVDVMETQTAQLKNLVGEQLAAVEQGRAILQQRAFEQLRLEVQKGDLDDVLETIRDIDKTMAESTARGEKVFDAFLLRLRQEALQGIKVRFDIEAAEASQTIRDAVRRLQGEPDVEVFIKGTPQFQRARDEIRGITQEVESVPDVEPRVQLVDYSELQRQIRELTDDLVELQRRQRERPDDQRIAFDIEAAERDLGRLTAKYEEFERRLQEGAEAGELTFRVGAPPAEQVAAELQRTAADLKGSEQLVATARIKIEQAQEADEIKTVLKELEDSFFKVRTEAEKDPSKKPLVDLFLEANLEAQKLAERRYAFIVERSAVDALLQVERDVRASIEGLSAQELRLLEDDEAAKIERVEGAVERLRGTLGRLETEGTLDQQVGGFASVLSALDTIEREVPTAKQVIADFRAEVQRQAAALDIEVRIDRRRLERDFDDVLEFLRQLQAQTPATSLELLRTEDLVRNANKAVASLDVLRASLERLSESRDPALLAANIQFLEQAIDRADAGTLNLSADMLALVRRTLPELRKLVAELEPLERARFIQIEAEARVQRGEIDAAERDLERLAKLAEQFPDVEIDIVIKEVRETLAKARDESNEGATEIKDTLEGVLNDITFDVIENSLRRNLLSMENQARSTADIIRGVFTSMIDAIIAQLARLAASALFKFVAQFFGGIGDNAPRRGRGGDDIEQRPPDEPQDVPSKPSTATQPPAPAQSVEIPPPTLIPPPPGEVLLDTPQYRPPDSVEVPLGFNVPEVDPIALAKPQVDVSPLDPVRLRPEILAEPPPLQRVRVPVRTEGLAGVEPVRPAAIASPPASSAVAATRPPLVRTADVSSLVNQLAGFQAPREAERVPEGLEPSAGQEIARALQAARQRAALEAAASDRESAAALARENILLSGPRASAVTVNADIRAIDSADFERYMRVGPGRRAMAGLALQGRGV